MGASSAKSHSDIRELERIVGAERVALWAAIDPEQQAMIQQALSPNSHVSGIVYPATPAHLAEVMAQVYRNRCPVLPCGAGSKLDWGGLIGGIPGDTAPLLVISTQQLNQLIEHAVDDLTVTVEAGMPFAALQATLAKAGQFLPIDPAYPNKATIGGILATADTGSLRQRYNSVRDLLLGITFVRSDGAIAKAGGRVVKNVAGYDLMKLLTGSYGTLGILTQVTLRVYPLPEASQTIVLSGSAAAITQATATVLQSALTPTAVDVLSASVVDQMGIAKQLSVAIRFQSMLASVQQQTQHLLDVGQTLGLTSTIVSNSDDAALWQHLQERMTPSQRDGTITCKIGVRPSSAVSVLQQIDTMSASTGFGQLHAASGLGKLVLNASTVSLKTLLDIRTLCQVNSGFLSILQAPASLKQQVDVWGYPGNALDLMRKLKQQFDPYALLSPHRFVGGM